MQNKIKAIQRWRIPVSLFFLLAWSINRPQVAHGGELTTSASFGDYLVVDVSGGPSATNYPVDCLATVPNGGINSGFGVGR